MTQKKTEQEHIPSEECIDGGFYEISARNFRYGIYRTEVKSFVGIRTKWGSRFLDNEDHWDTGEPHGTVKPIRLISMPPELSTHADVFKWIEDNTPKEKT